MIRFFSIALLLAAPIPLAAQSFYDSRAVTVAALEQRRRELDRNFLADRVSARRVFERVVLRVDNLHLGTVGVERAEWVQRLAEVSRARPIDTSACYAPGRFPETWRAECALKQATLYLEVDAPVITGDSATTRVHNAWLETSPRFQLVYTAVCLRLARRSTGWIVVRNCGTTSS